MIKSLNISRLAGLQGRAALNAKLREFFLERNVLEVETPLMGATAATDLNLEPIRVQQALATDQAPRYLQSSPEFSMKKLLAMGSGSIYQLGKAFRFDEYGKLHRPEFTLLEWYRIGYDESLLMDEVEELVAATADISKLERISYRELFRQILDLDPHSCTLERLRVVATNNVDFCAADYGRDDLLYLLMSHCIEPAMPPNCFIYDYPASQASLAEIEEDKNGIPVARRFELYLGSMEIANGYRELRDSRQLRQRLNADLAARKSLNRLPLPIDEELISAHEKGLPRCAGVALGVDRLLMVIMGATSIDDVMCE